MIFNTTNTDYISHDLTEPHGPMDPKYLYSTSYTLPRNQYHGALTPIASTDESTGYGLERLMFQKQEIMFSKIHMLHSEIYERHKLREANLYRICLDQCACRNLIFDMGDHVWDKMRIDFECKIIDLEQEKRREQTSYFKDILFLRKELRETLIEKLEEKQKKDLFKDPGEESPWNA